MKCRSCGFEIADKAIVCYRCGTPTAEPVSPSVAAPGRPAWLAVPFMVAIIVLGVWLIPHTPPASAARWAAWAALALATLVVVLGLRRSRRPRS